MKTIRSIAESLERIAYSLMFIEITLLKINDLEYKDIKGYAKDYNKSAKEVKKHLEKVKNNEWY